jgi:hypothetical protein
VDLSPLLARLATLEEAARKHGTSAPPPPLLVRQSAQCMNADADSMFTVRPMIVPAAIDPDEEDRKREYERKRAREAKDREDRAQTYVDICASFPSRPVFALFILARDLLGLTLLFSLTVPCQFVDFSRSPPTEPRPRRSDLTYRHPFLSLSLLHIILSPAA